LEQETSVDRVFSIDARELKKGTEANYDQCFSQNDEIQIMLLAHMSMIIPYPYKPYSYKFNLRSRWSDDARLDYSKTDRYILHGIQSE
jgi:hypothetical protein